MPTDPHDSSSDIHATIWTMIHGAAAGDAAHRDEFAQTYLPLIRRYLGERWRGSPLAGELEDASQEVFLECLRAGGVLESANSDRSGGFRAFLFGAIRNVARRHESARAAQKRVRTETFMPAQVDANEEQLGKMLDREWARCLMRQAAEHHQRTALARGATARQGVELLRLRFEEDLPIRDIAARWGEDPAVVHRRYRQARDEFRRSLQKVVAFHHPESTDLEEECARLLAVLGGD
jgi:RNA polymerase sigma factor (sigma-70 family)